MKKFRFSLDRVLAWRRLQLEREQVELDRVRGERDRLAHRVEAVRGERRDAEHRTSRALSFTGFEVATLSTWRAQMAKSLSDLGKLQGETGARLQQHQTRVRELDREVRLLERLRERRLSEWTHLAAKAEEDFAAEAFLARSFRLKGDEPAGA